MNTARSDHEIRSTGKRSLSKCKNTPVQWPKAGTYKAGGGDRGSGATIGAAQLAEKGYWPRELWTMNFHGSALLQSGVHR